MKRLLVPMLVLPGMTLVVIPLLLLNITNAGWFAYQTSSSGDLRFWFAAAFLGAGLFLAITSVRLLLSVGKGTPAPWDATSKLVVAGPYRYLRNPMITGALSILVAEALYFGSWMIFAWSIFFLFFNLIYLPAVEEKKLEDRHGKKYRDYQENVPRWFPRQRPWRGP